MFKSLETKTVLVVLVIAAGGITFANSTYAQEQKEKSCIEKCDEAFKQAAQTHAENNGDSSLNPIERTYENLKASGKALRNCVRGCLTDAETGIDSFSGSGSIGGGVTIVEVFGRLGGAGNNWQNRELMRK